jgi:hypothetical protein
MKDKDRGRLGVDPGAHEDLRRRLEDERRGNRHLQARLEQEAEVARRALEEAVKARTEREEYRRVLAAAIANEKRALELVKDSRDLAERTGVELRGTLLERGAAEGRRTELEVRMTALQAEHEVALRAAHDRAWALSEQHGRQMQAVVFERGQVLGRARELALQVPAARSDAARLARARARVNVAVGVALLLLSVALAPACVAAVASSAEAAHLEHLLGLGTWQLLAIEGLVVASALALGSFGLRELRVAERAESRARAEARAAPGGAPEAAGSGA